MKDSILLLSGSLCGFVLGSVLFLLYLRIFKTRRQNHIKKEMNFVINQAKSQAMRIEKSAIAKSKDMERKMKHKMEAEVRKEQKRVEDIKYQAERNKFRIERELKRKKEDLEQQLKEIEREKEKQMAQELQLEKATKKTSDKLEELNTLTEKIAGFTKEQAQEEIKKSLKEDVRKEIAPQLMSLQNQLKSTASDKAKLILAQAIARFASEVSTEKTISAIPIKNEETKGKIIGREGRNIRALESACGVDIIIDESQESILISCFDAVRREVALQSIQTLLEEGRVHPARIEEVVSKTKRTIFNSMTEEGKQVCFDLGIYDIKSMIVQTLGSLKYRSIEGSNILQSCIEVAHLAGLIASEIQFEEKTAKRAGLLHGIGLGIDHRLEGSYSVAGADFLKKHGESASIVQAIRAHRGEVPAEAVLDHILMAAYNLFRERPGARREIMENYITRMKNMESIANSFDGVIRSFAIQTGKEVRVFVDSGKVTDEQVFILSRDIAEKINKEMAEVGQLTVSVIREYRIVEHAR